MRRLLFLVGVAAIIGFMAWRFVQSLTREEAILIVGVLIIGGLGVSRLMKPGGKADP